VALDIKEMALDILSKGFEEVEDGEDVCNKSEYF
jgi:hypothetical protein